MFYIFYIDPTISLQILLLLVFTRSSSWFILMKGILYAHLLFWLLVLGHLLYAFVFCQFSYQLHFSHFLLPQDDVNTYLSCMVMQFLRTHIILVLSMSIIVNYILAFILSSVDPHGGICGQNYRKNGIHKLKCRLIESCKQNYGRILEGNSIVWKIVMIYQVVF